eukprot:378597_1
MGINTQNKILTQQHRCDSNMTLNDFISFGSIRDGSHIQSLNLLRELIMKKLKWNEKRTVYLILQTLWQGIPVQNYDFKNPIFCGKFIKEIANQLAAIEDNWNQYYVLFCIVFMLRRMQEFKACDVSQYLIKCRTICKEWIQKIEHKMCHENENEEKVKCRDCIVSISLCQCFTFYEHLQTESDAIDWLVVMNHINENLAIYPHPTHHHLFLIQMFRIIEDEAKDFMHHIHPLINDEVLMRFVAQKWKDGSQGQVAYDFKRFGATDTYEYKSKDNALCLQINVRTGSFLKNGIPTLRLPKYITKCQSFQYLFKDTILEVDPCAKPNTFRTKYKIKQFDYQFEYDTVRNYKYVIIHQINDTNGTIFEFIPKKYVQQECIPQLMKEFDHWKDVKTNAIQFRRSRFDPETTMYTWHRIKKMIVRNKDHAILVHQDSFDNIRRVFNRLEETTHQYIWKDTKCGTITLELLRFGLKFEIKKNEISSLEYNMNVSLRQGLDTLVGLKHKLVLSDMNGNQKVLVPCGQVISHAQSTQINLSSESKQRVAVYMVDKVLKCLRAQTDVTEWIYLALLHAKTSYFLPDRFTKMTGTEFAIHWIQKQCYNDGEPYTKQQLHLFQSIAECAPTRTYYPSHLKCM